MSGDDSSGEGVSGDGQSGNGQSGNGPSDLNVFRTASRGKGIPRIRQITRDGNAAGIAGREGRGISRKGKGSDIAHSRGMVHRERQGNTGECEGRESGGMQGNGTGRNAGRMQEGKGRDMHAIYHV